MTTDLIRYDLLVQDALKGVVRKVLTDAARDGLPGDHHFYVSFQTTSPGVRLSGRMREKYPDTMTIVLQHQFWDLAVTEHAFEVGLSFGGVPERLLVPFDALTGFFDPSVQFGLKFEIRETAPASAPTALAPVAGASLPGPAPAAQPRTRGAGSEPAETEPRRGATTPKIPAASKGPAAGKASPAGSSNDAGAPPATAARGEGSAGASAKTAEGEKRDADGAEVVSLDAFRKKT